MKPAVDTDAHDPVTYGVLSNMILGSSVGLWHAVSMPTANTLAAYDPCCVQD